MKNAARESASARARIAQLKTNRRAEKQGPPTGLTDIDETLKSRWKEVVVRGFPKHDLLAGLTVATIAMPLNVALAKAAGLPAGDGLIAGAIGGAVAAAFGGSNFQVAGPAAALNVMVFSLVQQFGTGAAAAAALVCGVVSIAISLFGWGKFANLLPKVVLAGFTTGVGLTLLNKQTPVLLGIDKPGETVAPTLWGLLPDFMSMEWLRDVHWLAVVCGLIVLTISLGLSHLKAFPSALLGIIVATFISYELDWDIARVDEVDVSLGLSLPSLKEGTAWPAMIFAALPLAILSCAESLISAKAVDALADGKSGYNANAELFGQGVGNLASGVFGGMAITGVIVRSSANLQAGARTRMAAIYHGVFLLLAATYFGHSMSIIPQAALAGILLAIAVRLMKPKVLLEAFATHKLHALAFVAAMVGTVMNSLMTGLAIGCLLVFLDHYLATHKTKHVKDAPILRPSPTIRAVVNKAGSIQEGHDTAGTTGVPIDEQAVWTRHVRTRPKIHPSAYVHPTASVIGWVELGREVNVAADTSVRADEGAPFYIGDRSNVQDGVVLHALKDKWVLVEGRRWAIWIGSDCSLAHQALVHGPSMIGARTFVGFKAIVHDSIIGEGCFIGHNALVVGVELPPRKRVPSGMVVDSLEKVASLPDVEHAHQHFNEDVVQVNRGLVVAYSRAPGMTGHNATNGHLPLEPEIRPSTTTTSTFPTNTGLGPIKQF